MNKISLTIFSIVVCILIVTIQTNESEISQWLNNNLNINPPKPERSEIHKFLDYWFNHQELYTDNQTEFYQQLKFQFPKVITNFNQGLLESWINTPNGCLALIIMHSHADKLIVISQQHNNINHNQHTKYLRQVAIDNQYDKMMPTALHIKFLLEI